MSYPQCLKETLAQYGVKPTGNVRWDQGVLRLMQQRKKEEAEAFLTIGPVITQAEKDIKKTRLNMPDLSDRTVFVAHVELLKYIANEIILKPQRRKFEIDDNNRDVIKFLLYYFNECDLAEQVFPGRGYKLHKNILLQGGVGVGKTMLMQIFSEYLKRTNNPRFFYNVSVTQMVNYYSIHNNIDRFLYNEMEGKGFQGCPVSLCLNDIGVDNRPFYGVDTLTIVNDFLHARNEIWANLSEYDRRFAHLTTNLTDEQLKMKFQQKDEYGRIVDRFKTYNVIPLLGESRR
ncbi:MAG: hypothetical protein NC411_10610 [Bacteroides sp.]|nr:hypothetical protein [Bacteroides sp.]